MNQVSFTEKILRHYSLNEAATELANFQNNNKENIKKMKNNTLSLEEFDQFQG